MNPMEIIATHTTHVSNKKALHFNVGNSERVELVAANANKVIATTLDLSTMTREAKTPDIMHFIKKAKSIGFTSMNLVEFVADIRKFAAKNNMLRKV